MRTPSSISTRLLEGFCVIGVLILALALRVVDLDRGFWDDEALEYMQGAAVPFWNTLTYQSFPVLHILTHLSLYIDDSEWALRLPSVVAGVGGVLVLYLFARALLGRTMAFVASLMLATTSFHIVGSIEARFYAIAALASVLMVWSLQVALERGRRLDWVRFTAASALGVLTQILLVPLLAALCGGALAWLAFRRLALGKGTPLRTGLLLSVCAGVSLTGLLFFSLLQNYALGDVSTWDSRVTYKASKEAIENEMTGEEEVLYQLDPAEYAAYYQSYFSAFSPRGRAALGALAMAGIAFFAARHGAMAFLVLGALVLTPVPFYFIPVHHWFHSRYFSELIPLAILAIAGGLEGVSVVGGAALGRVARAAERPALEAGALSMVRTGVALIFAVNVLPFLYIDLRALYEDDLAGGQHENQDNKRIALDIRERAAPSDFASQAYTRPNWDFYHRKYLANYLTDAAPDSGTTDYWYVNAHQSSFDWNDLPIRATRVSTTEYERPRNRSLSQYTLSLDEMTDYSSALHFFDGSPVQFPYTLTLSSDGETHNLIAEPASAMPHRYVEFIVQGSGPPQAGIVLEFLAEDGRTLWEESMLMRDPRARRGRHPSGAAAPMAWPDAGGPFTLKLATVTPPLTSSMRAHIVVDGDTRRGDVYAIDSVRLRGDWSDGASFTQIPYEDSGKRNSVTHWKTESGECGRDGVREGLDDAACIFESGPDGQFPGLESGTAILPAATVVMLRIRFQGELDAHNSTVKFLDEKGRMQDYDRLFLKRRPVRRRHNTITVESDGEWYELVATVKVPEGAAAVKLHLEMGTVDADAPGRIVLKPVRFHVDRP